MTHDDRIKKIAPLFPDIDAIYKKYAEQNHIPGYAFGIMLDGQLVHSGYGGYSNVAKKIPASIKSLFRIASMTKSITAMAVIKLRDQGKLHLHTPVHQYIPSLKNQRLTLDSPDITILDLLIHSAGFPQDDPWADRCLDYSEDALLALIEEGVSFSNPTGTIYEYSNLTYAMLGIIIHKAAGIPYQRYITDNILQPLKMTACVWDYTTVAPELLAHGYRWINDSWQEEALLRDGIFGAMGGIISSIESFSQYVALHQQAWPARDDADQGPVKRSSVREMQRPWQFNELNSSYAHADGRQRIMSRGYGYGLRWQRDTEGNTYVGHGGGLPGFGSHWLIMPDHGIGVIFFANNTYAVDGDRTSIQVLDTLVKGAQLETRVLPTSNILNEKQHALMTFLPDWDNAESSAMFAINFFLDNPLEKLKADTKQLFASAGKIINVGDVVPENQLRGHFVITGENKSIKISFTLTPHKEPLIQAYEIKILEP